MKNRIKLTSRDIEILNGCYSNTLMSFFQVHNRNFVGLSVPTVSNRLGQLVRGGLLTKIRLNLSETLRHPRETGVIYQTTRLGLETLRQYYPNRNIRHEVVPLNISSVSHDIILNDALSALRGRFFGVEIVNGRLWESGENHSGKRNPDAVILDPFGKPSVAIELELNAKSEKRYREIILQYRLNSQFENVLYVVPGDAIQEKISYQITNQKKIPGLSAPSTGKFYFATLLDLLKDPLTAPISNGALTLSLTDLSGQLARIGKNIWQH